MNTPVDLLTAQWWKLIREEKDEDLFGCRKCQQEFVVHKAGLPLPEECPNCSGQLVTVPAFLKHKKTNSDSTKDSKALKKLQKDSLLFVGQVYQFIKWLDEEMKKPSDNERGTRIARAVNKIEMSADSFSHFTLDQSFKSIAKLKGKKP